MPPEPPDPWLRPDWPAPPAVGALMSTRAGGVSTGPWSSMNLGSAVGDAPSAVATNRERLARQVGARPVFLRQVHGRRVVRLRAADASAAPDTLEADAAWTDEPGLACVVQVADCLPVLFAAPSGRAVGAAHAGWRGLAGGVLEQALIALCEGAACSPHEVVAWLGPCIGPQHFEVGADVLAGFEVEPVQGRSAEHFAWRPRPDGSPRWCADLPALARQRLARAGLGRVSGGGACTVSDTSRFFSFRRDGVTGRMAAAVWIRAD